MLGQHKLQIYAARDKIFICSMFVTQLYEHLLHTYAHETRAHACK